MNYKLRRFFHHKPHQNDGSIRDRYAHLFIKFRVDHELTVAQCAQTIGISEQEYKDYEAGLNSHKEYEFVSDYNKLFSLL